MQSVLEAPPTLETVREKTPNQVLGRVGFLWQHSRWWMTILLASSDLLGLLLSGYLAVQLRLLLGNGFNNPQPYYDMAPLMLAFLVAYAVGNLYPGIGLNPVEELRRLSISTSAIFLVFATAMFWAKSAEEFSRLLFSFCWMLALVILPFGRWLIRKLAIRLKLWGEPVALVGFGVRGKKLLEYLRTNPQLGFMPVVVVGDYTPEEVDLYGIPKLRGERVLEDQEVFIRAELSTAILVPPEVPEVFRNALIDERRFGLRRLILISNQNWIGGAAVVSHDLQGILGLEVQRNLLNSGERFVKRSMELLIIALGSVVALPVFLVCALLVHLDSRGGIFYGHKRVGSGGKELKVWKFRTMVTNADQVLQEYLRHNPDKQAEWDASRKLRDDPRVTRVGRLLRKTSLDELPQLWNVLKGEMSLVGPRPIVRDEMNYYRSSFALYSQVAPGITGLWQVSGRSDTSYEERIRLDDYYIRHWSIWMDIYILARTVLVVLKRTGAY